MEIGMVGLGRMGGSMARRLLAAGHRCVVYNRTPEPMRRAEGYGAAGAASLEDLVGRLPAPRAVWLMLPAGEPTETTVQALSALLARGDVVIDGGNTRFHDDVRRAAQLRPKGLHYLDVGTSGGVWGLERGYCLMIGGEAEPVARLAPIFDALAPGRGTTAPTPGGKPGTAERGWLHCGKSGSGHFVKMVHNGIEYALMQAYAEGFDILRGASSLNVPEERRYELALDQVAEVWRRGSVVSSWLLDLAAGALAEDPRLSSYSGVVPDSGEGRWTIEAALEEAVPAHVISTSLYQRFGSRDREAFACKLLSALRRQFGGHREPPQAP